MKIGKIPEAVLKRSVFNQINNRRPEILLGASVGEDCAAISVEPDEMLVMSADPVTGTVQDIGALSVQITVNDLASAGAEPVGIMLTVLLPESVSEKKLAFMMRQVEDACEKANIQVMGGHTEVTRAVNQPVISVAGIGKVRKGKLISTAGARPGMDIDRAKGFDQWLSVLPEARIAAAGGVSAMHDVTEGGIYGALWEMAEASGTGLEIDLKKIPVKQETIEICEFFDINPYELISSGSMLMAASDGNRIVRELEKQGIHAVVAGRATKGNDRILYTNSEQRFLEPPKTDELYKAVL